MLSRKDIEALLYLVQSYIENKKIVSYYIKKALAKPLKIKILERVIELFVVGFLVNVLSNLVFHFNLITFIIIMVLLSASLLLLFLIALKY